MPQLSIIVPVYNVENYLRKCIESILSQTFTDFELILIDDGSPDNCGTICDEYARADQRINVIHQENSGVSAARNAGLNMASGEFIGFIDSDDWIEPDMYETMISMAETTCADVVICGMHRCSPQGDFISTILARRIEYTQQDMLDALFGIPNPMGGSCCNKLFRSSAVSGKIRFNSTLRMAEDCVFLFDAFLNCNKAIQTEKTFYNILERPGSATRQHNIEMIRQLIQSNELLLKKARKYSPELECKATNRIIDDFIRYSILLKNTGKQFHKKWGLQYIRIRFRALFLLTNAALKGLLPKATVHRYLSELIKA